MRWWEAVVDGTSVNGGERVRSAHLSVGSGSSGGHYRCRNILTVSFHPLLATVAAVLHSIVRSILHTKTSLLTQLLLTRAVHVFAHTSVVSPPTTSMTSGSSSAPASGTGSIQSKWNTGAPLSKLWHTVLKAGHSQPVPQQPAASSSVAVFCQVVNSETYHGPAVGEEVYIGRVRGVPGEWGNKFVIGRDGTREDVCAKHRRALINSRSGLQRVREKLRGKPALTLICWCAPEQCHGDTLRELVMMSEAQFADLESAASNT